MTAPPPWDPVTDWKHTEINWIKLDISQEDLRRFTKRSDLKGLCHTIGFLMLIAATAACACWALTQKLWPLLVLALYIHGIFYGHFGEALHELGHNTVFATRWLSTLFTTIYGLLYWPWNPHLYRISHLDYHHRYTLYQDSDGEDVPNYIQITPALIFDLFFRVFQIKELLQNIARLLTLKPTSKTWRGRGYHLDTWEKFILSKAGKKDRRMVYRFAVYALVTQLVFLAVCIYYRLWFLPVLITLAPFYKPGFHSFFCATHQHTACQPNNPDFRISCGDAILDPLSSFLYWHMEYHIEHHMYASIPCYNLKKFSNFVADQLPKKEPSLPRLIKLNELCKQKYASWQNWRDNYGRYKGF